MTAKEIIKGFNERHNIGAPLEANETLEALVCYAKHIAYSEVYADIMKGNEDET